MAKGFEVDFVKQTITIVDAAQVDAEGAKEIVSLQQAGYKTVNKRNSKPNPSKGKTEKWYQKQLTEKQWEEFKDKKKKDNFIAARQWADEILEGNKEE